MKMARKPLPTFEEWRRDHQSEIVPNKHVKSLEQYRAELESGEIPELIVEMIPDDPAEFNPDSFEAGDLLWLLTEKRVKFGGQIWVHHQNDVDPWPSTNHAHDYQNNLVIDVNTGDIYGAGKRGDPIRRMRKKDLIDFKKKLSESFDGEEPHYVMLLMP